jgi:hypothetical protein
MGVQPPYLYDPVKSDGPRSPYKEFDPKSVTRASQTPKPRRPQHEGPLVSFNQHPEYVSEFNCQMYANNNAQFLLNCAIWKYECEGHEPLCEEVGEMDAKHPTGLEMFRAPMRNWTVGYFDSS